MKKSRDGLFQHPAKYAAQSKPKIDTEIAKKGHSGTGTREQRASRIPIVKIYRFLPILLGFLVFLPGLPACQKAPEIQEPADEFAPVRVRLGRFFSDVEIVEDSLYKSAALREDSEPEMAKEFFMAHARLRAIMAAPERKSVVLAAFLSREPSALRPRSFQKNGERLRVVVSLGPTEKKVGIFEMILKDDAWLITDFDGAWKLLYPQRGK